MLDSWALMISKRSEMVWGRVDEWLSTEWTKTRNTMEDNGKATRMMRKIAHYAQ